ncbi:MAG: alpha-E domain-containing protein [Steroidobacteraceae bacterium]
MLSRTADHVYWLGRYAERAENLARTLDVQYRLSLLPQAVRTDSAGWSRMLTTLGLDAAYAHRHDVLEPMRAIEFLAFDRGNPSSILSCLWHARENARAVRGSISSEMWETFNSTWLEARSGPASRRGPHDVAEFVDWVKYRAHLARGVVLGSMLRDEGYHFMQLGTFLERADGVVRMMLAQLGRADDGPGADDRDHYAWGALLRALSAFEIYRRVTRHPATPLNVVAFATFRPDVPRSVLRSAALIYENLGAVANAASAETERRAGVLHARLRFGAPDSLAIDGLEPSLRSILATTGDIAVRIGRDFLGHGTPA